MTKTDLPIVFTKDQDIARIQQNIRASLLRIQNTLTAGSNTYLPIFSPTGLLSSQMYNSASGIQADTQVVSNQVVSTTIVDFTKGNTHSVTLTADQVLTIQGGISGGKYTIALIQDATGGRSITSWVGDILWQAGAVSPATAANEITLYDVTYINNKYLIYSDGIGYI